MRGDFFLSRAAVTVTLACVTVVAGSALVLAVPALRQRLNHTPAEGPAYVVGERIDLPPTIHEASPLTLLLFSRAGCGSCQAAKPALASLVDRLADRPGVRTLLIARAGAEQEEREYLRDIGLDEGRLVGVDFSTLRLRRVPTIVLVDRRGEVRYSLEGIPTAVEQDALIRIAASLDIGR